MRALRDFRVDQAAFIHFGRFAGGYGELGVRQFVLPLPVDFVQREIGGLHQDIVETFAA